MLSILKILLSSLLGKEATVKYPIAPREPFAASRGHIGIDIDTCIFCGICARKCPTDAIGVNRAEKEWGIEPFRCIQCGGCVGACPKKCLFMNGERTPVSAGLTKDVFHARVSADAANHKDG